MSDWGWARYQGALLMDTLKEESKEMGKVRPMPFGRRKWAKRDIFTASLILSFHIPCIFAPFYFNWSAFWVAFILYILTGLFGISISYHRNLSHKSFKLPKWLEYVFAYCGVHAVQVWLFWTIACLAILFKSIFILN